MNNYGRALSSALLFAALAGCGDRKSDETIYFREPESRIEFGANEMSALDDGGRDDGVPERAPGADVREAILRVAHATVGWEELTGRNDGHLIDLINAATGVPKGSPYCASWVYVVGLFAGHPVYPRTAWSPSMLSGGTRDVAGARPADTFGIWFRRKGRIAHTGLVDEVRGSVMLTVEANTNSNAAVGSSADRDGEGIRRKRRFLSQVHSTRDWVSKPAKQ